MSYAGLLALVNDRHSPEGVTFSAEDYLDLDTGRRVLVVTVEAAIHDGRWRQMVKATLPKRRDDVQRVLLSAIRVLLGEVKAKRLE